MKVTLVYIDVKPECVERFKAASLKNHDGSRREPGNIRFDVLQNKDDPTKFTLYEVFADDAALDFHKASDHYKFWAAEAAECMSAPRSKTVYAPLAFD